MHEAWLSRKSTGNRPSSRATLSVCQQKGNNYFLVLNTKLDLEDYRIAKALGIVMPYKMYPNTTLPSKLINPSHEVAYFIQHNSNPFIQDSPLVQYSLSGLRPLANYTIRVTVHNGVSDQDPRGKEERSVKYHILSIFLKLISGIPNKP